MVKNKEIDFDKLREVTYDATLFMNRILDKTIMPIPECQEAMDKTKKIGIGIMGLHDLLIQMGVPYGSENGRKTASGIMKFISECADEMSSKLGNEEGLYSGYIEGSPKRRNANLTTVAPTGTLSMIFDCSSGIEPYYSVVTEKTVLDGTKFIMPNKWFKMALECHKNVKNVDEVLKIVKESGKVCIKEVPEDLWDIFKGAGEISPKDHILMQAEVQKYVDSSISKTINMPNEATVEDVKEVYELAYKTGCKGVTVYRDGSRNEQVLSSGSKKEVKVETNPKRSLPNELNAKRYRFRNQEGEPIYIIVCFDENEDPMEVFAKFPYDNRMESKDKTMMWTTICRLVSLALRCGTPISEIIKQLDRSSGSMFDLPAQLGKLLKSFMSQTHHGYKKECGECGGEVIFTEGCEKCLSCGNSKCS